jgi:hypothetical protein
MKTTLIRDAKPKFILLALVCALGHTPTLTKKSSRSRSGIWPKTPFNASTKQSQRPRYRSNTRPAMRYSATWV